VVGQSAFALLGTSDVYFLCDLNGVIDIDAE
jgi:hypothetical protein